jgi:hypothetical protein
VSINQRPFDDGARYEFVIHNQLDLSNPDDSTRHAGPHLPSDRRPRFRLVTDNANSNVDHAREHLTSFLLIGAIVIGCAKL